MLYLTRRRAPWATWAAIMLFAGLIAAQDARISPAPPTTAATLVTLNRDWRFRSGDNMAWAAPEFDDSAWHSLDADRPWGKQGYAGYHGFGWYRRHIDVGAPAQDGVQYALLVPEIGQAYEVYWNGAAVGRCGSLPPHPVWFADQAPHIFSLQGASSGVLALRVWNAPPLSDEDPGLTGGFAGAPVVGTAEAVGEARDALNYKWLRSRQFLLGQTLLYALVAVLSLLVWVRNREQWALFWMAGFTLPSVLILVLLRSQLAIPYTVSMAAGQPIDSLRDISLWFLLLWLMDLHGDRALLRATRGLAVLTLAANVLDGLLVALAWRPELLRIAQVGDAVITAANTLTQFFPLVLVAMAVVRHKRMNAASLSVALSAFAVEMATVIGDASAQGQRFTHWSLLQIFNGPLVVLGESTISPMNALRAVLFICIVYAVYCSFLDHRRQAVQMEQELRHASELQRVLIPDTPFELPCFHMTSAYCPALEVGGDFFQVLGAADGSNTSGMVIIGDVSGKGLAAAMSVSYLLGAIRSFGPPVWRPAELLERLNAVVVGHLGGGFATCLALRIDRVGRCTAATAGHPGPFIDGRELQLPGALPLGMVRKPNYEEVVFELRPGQVCALYTDGLLEARDGTGDLYGFERLERLFVRRPTAAQAAQAAVEFGQSDDITVLIIARECVAEMLSPPLGRELDPVQSPEEPASVT